MEEALRHCREFPKPENKNVSILVLMEEALRLFLKFFFLKGKNSFNPCFNGRGVKTFHRPSQTAEIQTVSILVLMEEALRLINWRNVFRFRQEFQSLF